MRCDLFPRFPAFFNCLFTTCTTVPFLSVLGTSTFHARSHYKAAKMLRECFLKYILGDVSAISI